MKLLEIWGILTKIEFFSKIQQSKISENFTKIKFFRKFDENRNFSKILTKIKIFPNLDLNRNFRKVLSKSKFNKIEVYSKFD